MSARAAEIRKVQAARAPGRGNEAGAVRCDILSGIGFLSKNRMMRDRNTTATAAHVEKAARLQMDDEERLEMCGERREEGKGRRIEANEATSGPEKEK